MQPKDKYFPDIGYIKIAPPEGLLRVARRGNNTLQTSQSASKQQLASELVTVLKLVEQFSALTEELELIAERTAEIKRPGDFRFRSDAAGDVRKARRAKYFTSLSKRVGKAYWNGRISGVRGSWDDVFDYGPPEPERVGEALAMLADALDPGCVPSAYQCLLRP